MVGRIGVLVVCLCCCVIRVHGDNIKGAPQLCEDLRRRFRTGQVNMRKPAKDPPKAMPPNRMDGLQLREGGKGGVLFSWLRFSFLSNTFLYFCKMEMLVRKDGSKSRRGLWDNIRKNAGSGKKPTKQMLEQEKKIKRNASKKSKK